MKVLKNNKLHLINMYLSVITILIFVIMSVSCKEQENEKKVIETAFKILNKPDLTEKEINKYYEFPFYNDGYLDPDVKSFLEFQKQNLTSLQEFINKLNIQIINSYDYEKAIVKIAENLSNNDKLLRLINLHKGNVKIFEIAFNKEDYINDNNSSFILYNINEKKLFGIIK